MGRSDSATTSNKFNGLIIQSQRKKILVFKQRTQLLDLDVLLRSPDLELVVTSATLSAHNVSKDFIM